MTFSPQRFEGLPLPDLLTELSRLGEQEVVAGLTRHHRLLPAPGAGGFTDPTIEWRTSWLTPPDPGQTLPGPGHPDVSAADVELGEYLACGKQGVVYSGRVRSTGLVVAVKVIHAGYATWCSPPDEAPAVREARVAAKVRHRNILRVFEARRAGAFWVVVMEFLQGKDLSRVEPPSGGVRPLLGQLADAVLALALARVVHRDIKPANVVLRRGDDAPVLVDFGLAFDLDSSDEPPGILKGTPLFMAPEAFGGGRPDPSWDAYSLGMTGAWLVLRKRLPVSGSVTELMDKKVRGDFDRQVIDLLLGVRDDAVSNWCRGLLGKPTRRQPLLEEARRWASAGDSVREDARP
jgi:hypothetical protein